MIKLTLTTISAFAIATMAYAQEPDKALARVTYHFSHVLDTTREDRVHTEDMLLVIGKNASVYTSYDRLTQTINRRKLLDNQAKNQINDSNSSFTIDGRGRKPTIQTDYFYFAKENRLVVTESVYNEYLVEEPASNIDWKISADTASFSGIPCKKATSHFKGRNWIAWYAIDLPFQSGPWKLNGLPGLIIEAYDEHQRILFHFGGIALINDKARITDIAETAKPNVLDLTGVDNSNLYLANEIKLPPKALKASRADVNKLKEARANNPVGFMKAQMAGTPIHMIPVGTPKNAGPKLSISVLNFNNPLELPETK